MAWLYQFLEDILGLYKEEFEFIFNRMYEETIYTKMGLLTLLISGGLMALFYFLYNNPYAKLLHWITAMLISGVIVSIITFGVITSGLADYLVDSDLEVQDFTKNLRFWYAGLNFVLACICSFLWSLILRKWSKIQMHIPF
tara:strand:- start:28132 stop:28554 length:423 start_codon:yes stop_codon:yes gene_type:complete